MIDIILRGEFCLMNKWWKRYDMPETNLPTIRIDHSTKMRATEFENYRETRIAGRFHALRSEVAKSRLVLGRDVVNEQHALVPGQLNRHVVEAKDAALAVFTRPDRTNLTG